MKRIVFTSLVAISLAGCTNYYKVTDPTTNRVYYTTELSQKGNGSASLKDARTGNMVTVQNTEVEQIKKEQFESGKNAAPTETPAKPAM